MIFIFLLAHHPNVVSGAVFLKERVWFPVRFFVERFILVSAHNTLIFPPSTGVGLPTAVVGGKSGRELNILFFGFDNFNFNLF